MCTKFDPRSVELDLLRNCCMLTIRQRADTCPRRSRCTRCLRLRQRTFPCCKQCTRLGPRLVDIDLWGSLRTHPSLQGSSCRRWIQLLSQQHKRCRFFPKEPAHWCSTSHCPTSTCRRRTCSCRCCTGRFSRRGSRTSGTYPRCRRRSRMAVRVRAGARLRDRPR